MNLDAEIAAAREHLHRSIGQRARWARYAIAERTEHERTALHVTMDGLFAPPPIDPLQAYYDGFANMAPIAFRFLLDPFYKGDQ